MSKGITRRTLRKVTEALTKEMNAKNEAYAYILSKGMYKDFRFFLTVMKKLEIDPHTLCVGILNDIANDLPNNQVEC